MAVAVNNLTLAKPVSQVAACFHGQLLKHGSCLCLLPKQAVQHLKHPYKPIFLGRKASTNFKSCFYK